MNFEIKEKNIEIDIESSILRGQDIIIDVKSLKTDTDTFINQKATLISPECGKLALKLENGYTLDITNQQDIIDNIYNIRWIGKSPLHVETYTSEFKNACNLKRARMKKGLSQSALAEKSGVNLRVIQSYELNPEAICQATTINVCRLAKALSCKAKDLIEIEKTV